MMQYPEQNTPPMDCRKTKKQARDTDQNEERPHEHNPLYWSEGEEKRRVYHVCK